MSKPLDLIEVMALTLARRKYGDGGWNDFPEHARDIALDTARDQIADLEKEGYVVVKLREPLSDADIENVTGVTDLIRGTPNPLAPGAPTPQQDRLLSEMAARPGISHPQAVYTPEPPKEES